MPQPENQPPRIKTLLLRLILLLVGFVTATGIIVLIMYNKSLALTEASHKELLPKIHDHQRAALNLERLERMGDLVVYGGNLALIRKNALAAQVLAYQPSLHLTEYAKTTVRSAFELIKEVRYTRQQLLSTSNTISVIERNNLHQLERTLQIRWGEYKQQLFELQNRIISDATNLQAQNMQQITANNNLILMVAGCGISVLLLICVIIGYNLYRHLITPVTQASLALSRVEQREGIQLTSPRYQELHNIFQAVRNLSTTMQKLHEMATCDSLTGCQNRGYFMEQAQTALANAQRHLKPLSLVMLDVDHFKRVNDRFGHATGDKTLKLCTRWIQEMLPEQASIGRLGGEEFALLLPDVTEQQAMDLSEKVRRQIAEASTANKDIPAITISLGVETLQAATDEIDTLLSQADKALYQAKAGGRNRTILHRRPETAAKDNPGERIPVKS